MNKQPDIRKKVEATLESLDGIQRAEPTPYFFTRLKARLERDQKNIWEKTGMFLARPAVAIAGLFFILALNAFILFQKEETNSVSAQLQEDESVIAATTAGYDYENLEP